MSAPTEAQRKALEDAAFGACELVLLHPARTVAAALRRGWVEPWPLGGPRHVRITRAGRAALAPTLPAPAPPLPCPSCHLPLFGDGEALCRCDWSH